jgi:cytochrome c biogenesis protein ResB
VIAKKDPGQGIVWLAFASLISGILIGFYFPRRRVWLRFGPEREVSIVGRSDRYVDFNREFGRLLDDLVATRRA